MTNISLNYWDNEYIHSWGIKEFSWCHINNNQSVNNVCEL